MNLTGTGALVVAALGMTVGIADGGNGALDGAALGKTVGSAEGSDEGVALGIAERLRAIGFVLGSELAVFCLIGLLFGDIVGTLKYFTCWREILGELVYRGDKGCVGRETGEEIILSSEKRNISVQRKNEF